jgi:outer membrane protein assembly factor BamB
MESLGVNDPTTIGGFRLYGSLGSGGMGRVFLGFSSAGRAVAVKVIHPQLARDQAFRARFRQEVSAARAVSGLYTAQVVAAGLEDNPPWLATALVPGPSLAEVVAAADGLSAAALCKLAAGLAEALAAIHACNVVHRDLKPANVVLAADGPRVIDFGISRALGGTALTTTGAVIGTPAFMSPEQAAGAPVGPASDIFSLGSVLTYAATGTGPFGDDNAITVLYRIVHNPPALDGVPESIRQLVADCLAKDPADRPSPARLQEALAALSAGARISAATFWPEPVTELIRVHQVRLDAELPPAAPSIAEDARSERAAPSELPVELGDQATQTRTPYTAAAQAVGQSPSPATAGLDDQAPRFVATGGLGAPGALSQRPGPRVTRRRMLVGLAGASAVAFGVAGWELSQTGPQQHHQAGLSATKLPKPGSRIWKFHSGGAIGSPALADGVVYVGSADQNVYALRTSDGKKIWSRNLGSPAQLTPTVASDVVYIGSDDGRLHALRASDGAELWSRAVGLAVSTPEVNGGFDNCQPAVSGSVIYVGSSDANLYALRTSDGSKIWQYQTHWTFSQLRGVWGQPVVTGGVIYICTVYGNVDAVRASDGQKIWAFTANGFVKGPVVADEVVYAAGLDRQVYALRAADGSKVWSSVVGATNAAYASTAPLATGGAVYVGDWDHRIYALRVADGSRIWTFETGGYIGVTPTVVGGVVYVGSDDHNVYALRASDGSKIWSYVTGGQVESRPAVAGSTVYVGSNDGSLYALET